MQLNIAKCKHLKYGSNASSYEYYMNEEGYNSKLNVVSSEKDLGVWITSKPDFTLQCEKASAVISWFNKEELYQPDKRIISNTVQDIHLSTLRILCFNLESILSKKHQ